MGKPGPGVMHGACSKTREFGHSHWISTVSPCPKNSYYLPYN